MWWELQRMANNLQQLVVVIHFSTRVPIHLLPYIPRVQWKAPQPTPARVEPQTNNKTEASRKNWEMPCVSWPSWLTQCPFSYRQQTNICTDRCKSLWSRTTPFWSVIPQRPLLTLLTNKKCSRFKKWTTVMKMKAIPVTRGRTWTLSVTSRSLSGRSRHLIRSTLRLLAIRRHLVEIKTS